MMIYEENERAGNILAELLEAEKLEIDSGMEELYSFTYMCGGVFSIVCC